MHYLSWFVHFSLSLAHYFNSIQIFGTSKYFLMNLIFFICYLLTFSSFLPHHLIVFVKNVTLLTIYVSFFFLSIVIVMFGLCFVNEFSSCSIYINLCFFIINFHHVFPISYNIISTSYMQENYLYFFYNLTPFQKY